MDFIIEKEKVTKKKQKLGLFEIFTVPSRHTGLQKKKGNKNDHMVVEISQNISHFPPKQ